MTLRLTAAVALLLGGNLLAADPLKSGPQVGAANDRSGFIPQFVAGASAGDSMCPVWNPQYDLVALVFARDTSDALTSLVKKIDQRLASAAGKAPRPVGAYVIFESNVNGLDQRLRDLASKAAIKHVPLCIGPAPKNYELSPEADLTVVIYRLGKRRREPVMANFALRKGELDETKADAIVKALSDVLPK
jgi:hypothetical protein